MKLEERIDAATLKLAVLGESLPHTWSPVIHNTLFREAGRNAVYMALPVPRGSLAACVEVLRSGLAGCNVTIPYKVQIIPLLDEVDDAVRACGAVNTVENRGGRLIGHITDGLGMMSALTQAGVPVSDRSVCILGCGGAARVAGYEFLKRGCRVIWAARDIARAEALASEMAAVQPDGAARIGTALLSEVFPEEGSLLVNCTPVGMYPHEGVSPVGREAVSRCAAVFDAVYNPTKTELLRLAEECGAQTVGGLSMLFRQAVEAQRFWFGQDIGVSETVQEEIYRELLKRFC